MAYGRTADGGLAHSMTSDSVTDVIPEYEGDDWGFENYLDAGQLGLAGLGLTPGVGFVPDLIDAGISATRGAYGWATDSEDYGMHFADTGLALAGALPVAGLVPGAGRLALKTARATQKTAQAKRFAKAIDPLVTVTSGKFEKMNLAEAREFASVALGRIDKAGIVKRANTSGMTMAQIRKKLAKVKPERLAAAGDGWAAKMKRVGGLGPSRGVSPNLQSTGGRRLLGAEGSSVGRALDAFGGSRVGGKASSAIGAARRGVAKVPGARAAMRLGEEFAENTPPLVFGGGIPNKFGRKGVSTGGRKYSRFYGKPHGRGYAPYMGDAARKFGRKGTAALAAGKVGARSGRLSGGLADASTGDMSMDYSFGHSRTSPDSMEIDTERNFAEKNLIGDTGVLVPHASSRDASLVAKLQHHDLVQGNPDADPSDLNAKGAPGHLTRRQRIQGGIITHDPLRPGGYQLVDRDSFKRLPSLTYRQKQELGDVEKQERKERRIAKDPVRYAAAFKRRASRLMNQEIKRAKKQGNMSRVAQLELDIADPHHPQVLLRMGAFNNRGLGGTNQKAYFEYLKNYTKEQNKKRDLTPEEQMYFVNSHLGPTYQKQMSKFSVMELEIRKMLTTMPENDSRAKELAKRLASLAAEKAAAEQKAQKFSDLYSQVDRGGDRSTVPKMSTQYLPPEAMLLPQFSGPDARSTGSGVSQLFSDEGEGAEFRNEPFYPEDSRPTAPGYRQAPYPLFPERTGGRPVGPGDMKSGGMSVAGAVDVLATGQVGGAGERGEDIMNLASHLENDPTFYRKVLDHVKTTRHISNSRQKKLMKNLRIKAEEAIVINFIEEATEGSDGYQDLELRDRLLSTFKVARGR